MSEQESRLDAYARALRACLGALDDAGPDEPGVARAFRTLELRFSELGDLAAARAAVLAGPGRDRFDERLEEVTGLRAVLVATLARERERLLGLLARCREARRGRRDVALHAAVGRTCDVEG